MKTLQKLFLSTVAAVIFTGCMPIEFVDLDIIETTKPYKFDATTYEADATNMADITGVWLITSRDSLRSFDQEDLVTGVVTSRQTKSLFRQGCMITEILAPSYDVCGDIATLSGSTFTLDDGEGSFTVNVENNRMSGIYYRQRDGVFSYESDLINDSSWISTFTATVNFVKLGASDLTLGTFSTESEGISETIKIAGFVEENKTLRRYEDDMPISFRENSSIICAYDNTGQDISVGFFDDGSVGVGVETATFYLDDYEETAEVILDESTISTIAVTYTGIDYLSSNSFTGSIDITL